MPRPGGTKARPPLLETACPKTDRSRRSPHSGSVATMVGLGRLLSIEGNTALAAFDHNGWIQTLKEVDTRRLQCYVAPMAA